jgi:hypothetical protein
LQRVAAVAAPIAEQGEPLKKARPRPPEPTGRPVNEPKFVES